MSGNGCELNWSAQHLREVETWETWGNLGNLGETWKPGDVFQFFQSER